MLKEILESVNENNSELFKKIDDIIEDPITIKNCCSYKEILVGMSQTSKLSKAVKEIKSRLKDNIDDVIPIYKMSEDEALELYGDIKKNNNSFLKQYNIKNFESFHNDEFIAIFVK